MTRYLVLVVGLLAGLSIGSAAPAPSALQIGNWSGGPQFDARTKQFERCAATLNNGSGTNLSFSIDRRFAWGIGLSNPAWTFGRGHSFGLNLTIGNRDQIRQVAHAVDTNRLELRLEDSMTVFARLRVMPQLRAAAGGLTVSFDLRDNHDIMQALTQCVLQHTGPVRNPKARNPPRPANPLQSLDRSDALRAEASAIAEGLISYAELGTARMLGNNLVPDGTHAHAIWQAGHVTGSVSIVQPGGGATADGLASDLIRFAAANCQGRFFVASMPDKIERLTALRLFTSCQSETATSSIFQTILARSAGGLYLVTTMIDRLEYVGAIQGSADELDTRIRTVLAGVLARAAQRANADETEAPEQPR